MFHLVHTHIIHGIEHCEHGSPKCRETSVQYVASISIGISHSLRPWFGPTPLIYPQWLHLVEERPCAPCDSARIPQHDFFDETSNQRSDIGDVQLSGPRTWTIICWMFNDVNYVSSCVFGNQKKSLVQTKCPICKNVEEKSVTTPRHKDRRHDLPTLEVTFTTRICRGTLEWFRTNEACWETNCFV